MTWTYKEYSHKRERFSLDAPTQVAKEGTTVKEHSYHADNFMLEIFDHRNHLYDPAVNVRYVKLDRSRANGVTYTFNLTHNGKIWTCRPNIVTPSNTRELNAGEAAEIKNEVMKHLGTIKGHAKLAELRGIAKFLEKHA